VQDKDLAPSPPLPASEFPGVWEWIKQGYLKLVDPLANALVARRVHPNTITTVGLFSTLAAGIAFGAGRITLGGWILSITAVFDVLDGLVARRSGMSSKFGAFYDSTLDRIADGVVLGGLTVFWASEGPHHSQTMVVVGLLAIVGAFLTSYTRARAEGLGLDAKVGMMQRPERVVLLAAPQALFGLALDGLILQSVVVVLAITSWITVWQRIAYVHSMTSNGKQ
jgi:CDP-diacylglycerol--glycerol-3-phosphate 3-phosphatidyltransferase